MGSRAGSPRRLKGGAELRRILRQELRAPGTRTWTEAGVAARSRSRSGAAVAARTRTQTGAGAGTGTGIRIRAWAGGMGGTGTATQTSADAEAGVWSKFEVWMLVGDRPGVGVLTRVAARAGASGRAGEGAGAAHGCSWGLWVGVTRLGSRRTLLPGPARASPARVLKRKATTRGHCYTEFHPAHRSS